MRTLHDRTRPNGELGAASLTSVNLAVADLVYLTVAAMDAPDTGRPPGRFYVLAG